MPLQRGDLYEQVPALALRAIALFLANDAAAFCLPMVHYRYVGDAASGIKRTDNDIQSAISNTTCPGTMVVTRTRWR